MKITVRKLIESKETLKTFLNSSELPFAISYRLSDIVPALDEELKKIEKFNNDLVSKYGTLQENGTIAVLKSSPNLQEFINEREAFLNEEFIYNCQSVKVSELMDTKIKLTPVEISNLKEVGLLID